jgi:hypothetical protein
MNEKDNILETAVESRFQTKETRRQSLQRFRLAWAAAKIGD